MPRFVLKANTIRKTVTPNVSPRFAVSNVGSRRFASSNVDHSFSTLNYLLDPDGNFLYDPDGNRILAGDGTR